MTNALQPTEGERDTKAPIVFTISDASTRCPAHSPASTASSAAKPDEEVVWKTLPLRAPEDPTDTYHKHYSTVQPVNLYEKSHEKGHIPPYMKQYHRQTSEAPSMTPSRRSRRSARSKTPKRRSRFLRSIHYIGSKHRLYGFRHIVIVVILVVAWLLGSLMFWAIEAPAEKVVVADTYTALHEEFDVISADFHTISATNITNEKMAAHVKAAYIKLLGIEGKYKWSAIYKKEDSVEGTYTWTFGSAFFFTFTLFTTVGYGTIAPGTDLGRFCVIWYSCIFYPFSLVVVRDLGQVILVAMTRAYGRLLIKIRTVRGFLTTDDDTIKCPLSIICVVSMGFIAILGVFFHYWDTGPEEGLGFYHAFYFSYLSYTMIGFGDLNPVNVPYDVVIAILVTAGLPLMRVVTKGIVIAMENGYFGTMLYVEARLEGKVYGEEVKLDKEAVAAVTDAGVESDSGDSEDDEEKKIQQELSQNFTIRSIAKFMSSNRDVYNGDFGRVELRKSDL